MSRTVILLMPWGRVGSNLVNSIVASSKRTKVFNEPLTRIQTTVLNDGGGLDDIWPAQRDWLSTTLGSFEGDVFVNLAAESIRDPIGFRDVLMSRDPTYLVLDRRDDLAVAVSALRTEFWVREGIDKGETRLWSIPKDQAIEFRPTIPVERIQSALEIIYRGRRNIDIITAESRPTRYFYEDLISDMKGVVGDILDHCGIARFDYQINSGKFGSNRLDAMIANSAEVWNFAKAGGVETELS